MDRTERAKAIGHAIRRARNRLDLSQEKFGEVLGEVLGRDAFHGDQVSRWESGSSAARPDAEVLVAAAEMAKEPVGALLDLDYWERLARRLEGLASRLDDSLGALDTARRRV